MQTQISSRPPRRIAPPPCSSCKDARRAGLIENETPCCAICHDRLEAGTSPVFSKLELDGRPYRVCCHVLSALVGLPDDDHNLEMELA